MVVNAENAAEVERLALLVAAELSELIHDVAVGAAFEVPPGGLCWGLEFYLPALLSQRYPECERMCLDGIFPLRATRTAACGAELIGLCLLMDTNRVTAFRLRVRLSAGGDTVAGVRLELGERADGSGVSWVDRNSRLGGQVGGRAARPDRSGGLGVLAEPRAAGLKGWCPWRCRNSAADMTRNVRQLPRACR